MTRNRNHLVAISFLTILLCGCHSGTRKESISPDELNASIRKGINYLIQSQNHDGSWGSATETKAYLIYSPIPGGHHSFKAATTSLCISALLETNPGDPQVSAVLDRAEAFVLRYLPRVRRSETNAIYNVWAHAYGIRALVRLLDRPGHEHDVVRTARIKSLIEHQIRQLQIYEFVGGGWGYLELKTYNFQEPTGDPTSFTTATVLIALHEAQEAGFQIPQPMRKRAIAEVVRQRNPNFTYHYSRGWWIRPMGPINRPGGSLGRSQACNAALRFWGDEAITDEVLREWLERLFRRQGWLDMGRKRPVVHESWFAVAGYFYYYGHYYAALCIEMLPHDDRPHFQQLLARTLIERQEKDGSWFDFPLYAYHKPYGTAYALMALQRCKETEKR